MMSAAPVNSTLTIPRNAPDTTEDATSAITKKSKKDICSSLESRSLESKEKIVFDELTLDSRLTTPDFSPRASDKLPSIVLSLLARSLEEAVVRAASCPSRAFRDNRGRTACRKMVETCPARTGPQARSAKSPASTLRQ